MMMVMIMMNIRNDDIIRLRFGKMSDKSDKTAVTSSKSKDAKLVILYCLIIIGLLFP